MQLCDKSSCHMEVIFLNTVVSENWKFFPYSCLTGHFHGVSFTASNMADETARSVFIFILSYRNVSIPTIFRATAPLLGQ